MKTVNKTDVGRIRTVNEDSLFVRDDFHGFTIAVVADGIGGHQAGEVASQIAVEAIERELQSLQADVSLDSCKDHLLHAIKQANMDIFKLAEQNDHYQGMGTTVVAALVQGNEGMIGHIGDSRVYLFENDGLRQLTEDHSLVNELVKSGQISPAEADHHPRRNVLTRALGTDPQVAADIYCFQWKPGDVLMLCSDGLSDLVDSEAMSEILRTNRDLEWKADRLVNRALEAGGDDNITVVLLAHDSDHQAEKG